MISPDELLLRDFAPRAQVVLPAHEVARSAVPAIDAHAHLGRWLSALPADALAVVYSGNVRRLVPRLAPASSAPPRS
jgi:hypothetical protein